MTKKKPSKTDKEIHAMLEESMTEMIRKGITDNILNEFESKFTKDSLKQFILNVKEAEAEQLSKEPVRTQLEYVLNVFESLDDAKSKLEQFLLAGAK